MSAMARARIKHMENAAEVCLVAIEDLPNHPGLCLEIVRSAERELLERRAVARAAAETKRAAEKAARPWWRFW